MEIRESTLAYINSMSGQPITANKLIAILLKWCFETTYLFREIFKKSYIAHDNYKQ